MPPFTVECSLPESFVRNITHGTVTVERTYIYQEKLNVMCDFTYALNPEEIVCRSDGSWSGVPTCLSTSKSDERWNSFSAISMYMCICN